VTLKDAALAYHELMKYRYSFLLGRKGKTETLVLSFPKESFHHLAGLHKRDIMRVKNKKYALEIILDGEDITKGDFSKAQIDRWNCLCRLKTIIETNSFVFRLLKQQLPGSKIHAEYVLTDQTVLYFVKTGEPVSVFTAREDQLVNVNHSIRLTTLKIERENLETGLIESIFVSDSYKEY